MKSDFFKRHRFKKIGPLDPNRIIYVFRKINSFLNTHRIKKGFLVYFLFIVVIPFVFCVGFVHQNTHAVLNTHHIVLEVNSEFDPLTYIKEDYDVSKLRTIDSSELDISKTGSYSVYYKKPILEYVLYVDVVDTTAPTITDFGSLTYYVDEEVDYSQQFRVEDNSNQTPTMIVDDSAVDYSTVGTYSINIEVKDHANNSTTYTKEVKIVDYTGVVYLTFDDGPSDNTKEIVDILDDYNINGTFFVICNKSSKRKYIQLAYNHGNAIGLHTGNHKYSQLYASTSAYFDDLNRVSEMVETLIGKKITNIRFPGGSSNTVSNQYCQGIMNELIPTVKELGYTYYDWNVDSGDAKSNTDAYDIYLNSVNTGYKNVMILLHDASAKTETVKALPMIIENFQKRGYVFRTIEDGDFVCQHIS